MEGEWVRSMIDGGLAMWESESESGILMSTGRRTGWLDGCGCGVFAEESLGPGELAKMAAALASVCSAEAPVSLDSSDSV